MAGLAADGEDGVRLGQKSACIERSFHGTIRAALTK
jgi:hypothetical protein